MHSLLITLIKYAILMSVILANTIVGHLIYKGTSYISLSVISGITGNFAYDLLKKIITKVTEYLQVNK